MSNSGHHHSEHEHEHHKRNKINAILTVKATTVLSSFIRIVFDSDKPLKVESTWCGPHLKLLMPDPMTGEVTLASEDRSLAERIRTYSIRKYDASSNQLTVDFAIHEQGLGTSWSQKAKAGDQLCLVAMGSKTKYQGEKIIFVGDITALPAIMYSIEHLPINQRAWVIIEVDHQNDIVDIAQTDLLTVQWLVKNKDKPTQLVDNFVQIASKWQGEDASLQFWGGMEAIKAQQIRRTIKELFPNLSMGAMHVVGYWKAGFVEGSFKRID